MDTNTNTCDVVIPYRKAHPDTELIYSLKSLQNLPHRHIYVVGDKPLWYKGNHIPIKERKWLKHHPIHNQEIKIRTACELAELSDEFILSNDDFFVMKPVKLKHYHRGLLLDQIQARKRKDQYTNSLIDAYDILRHMGIANPLSYELHVPMLLNRQKRLQLSYDMEKYFLKRKSPVMRSVYGNLYVRNSEYMDDVKNIDGYKDSTFLSTNETTFTGNIGKYIKLMLR